MGMHKKYKHLIKIELVELNDKHVELVRTFNTKNNLIQQFVSPFVGGMTVGIKYIGL